MIASLWLRWGDLCGERHAGGWGDELIVRCLESFVDTWWIRLASNGIQMHKGHLNSDVATRWTQFWVAEVDQGCWELGNSQSPSSRSERESAKFASISPRVAVAKQWQEPMQYPPYAYNAGYPFHPQAINARAVCDTIYFHWIIICR